ncbi:hypothetical protein C0J52_08164 [Blattella germanica]|nr:hypothetical protein C0J52_08164 [Blattella germanica]
MWKVREIADKVTNVVMNYTEVEAKVREATNDDAWGPTVFYWTLISLRLFCISLNLDNAQPQLVRINKSLLLLNYLVRNGSERVVTSAREHIYDLRSLENYTYVDEFGKDQGINVRHKVHELIDFIQDDDKLREERKKAKKNKDKYVGMSSGGGSGWDDTPKWRRDEFSDWDPDKGGGMSRGMGSNRQGSRSFEDVGNNSDEGDRYDSDSEGGSHPRRGREYRDKDSDSLDSAEKKDRSGSKPGTPARTKTSGIKKIDLGAAAHYGKDQNSQASDSPSPSACGGSIGKISERVLAVFAMFTKQDQRSWLKIECARGRNARQCYEILQDVCGENALPYRTVARWVKAFNEGRQNVTDMPRSGHPTVSEENVQNVNALVLADRNSTIRQLANDTRLAPSTVLKILKKHLQMRKIASRWTSTPVKSAVNINQQSDKGEGDLLSDILGGSTTVSSVQNVGDDDDFNPRASEISITSPTGEFGDFTSAFGKPPAKPGSGNDEFADFSKAFTENVTLSSNNTTGNSYQQLNTSTLDSSILTSTNGNIDTSQSNTDFLSGLGGVGFSSFNVAPIENSSLHPNLMVGNHNLNPLEANFPSKVIQRSQEEMEGNCNSGTSASSESNRETTAPESEIISEPETKEITGSSDDIEVTFQSDINQFQRGLDVSSSFPIDKTIHDILAAFASFEPQNEPKNLQAMKAAFKMFIKLLPGPFTPQKFSGIDFPSAALTRFYDVHYKKIVKSVLEKYSPVWVDEEIEDLIKKVIVVEGSGFILFHESLSVLISELRECKGPSQKEDFIVNTLEKLILSGAMVSAILELCAINKDDRRSLIIRSHLEQMWLETVQMIVSLPSRVANQIKRHSKLTFFPDTCSKILCCHVSKCIQFLYDAKDFNLVNFKAISILLSKVIINFSSTRNSNGISQLIEIFEHWCVDPTFRIILQNVFFHLKNEAVGTICKIIFQVCSSSTRVKNLIGNIVCWSNSWYHVLVVKMLLMTFQNWQDSSLVENLIGYLACVQFEDANDNIINKPSGNQNPISSNTLLFSTVIDLLTIWSDGSALHHTPLEQHIYITQAIILGTVFLSYNQKLTQDEKREIQLKLHTGIPVHLNSPIQTVRAISMITAEIIVELLAEKSDDEEVPKLKFEYDDMSEETKTIVNSLKCLSTKYAHPQKEDNTHLQLSHVDDLLKKLEGDCRLGNTILTVEKELPILDKVANHVVENVEINENAQAKTFCSDSPLDSDDDEFVPYDMTELNMPGDTKISVKKQPKYLRDVLAGLLETEDFERFTLSFEVMENLITQQLPDDDVSLAVELLELLIALEEKFCIENFDFKRFSACIAIVTIFPTPCAEYLCSQFNSGLGKFSINQLMFILDCLAGAAKKLSFVETQVSEKSNSKDISKKCVTVSKSGRQKLDPVQNSIEDIVKKRIESHTRRFATSTKSPVCHANKFSSVAGSFFFPLLFGFCQNYYNDPFYKNSLTTNNCVLLVNFLQTLAVVMNASVNCTKSLQMGKELLDLCWSLRYHSDAKVRLSVMSCVGAVILAVPKPYLQADLQEPLLECRMWLLDLVKPGMRQGEPNSECRELATYLLLLIDNTCGDNLLALMQDM